MPPRSQLFLLAALMAAGAVSFFSASYNPYFLDIAIRVVLNNIDAVGGPRGMIGIPAHTTLFGTFGLAAVTIYVVWAMVNSSHGRGFIAVADDEIAAEAMGINTTRFKIKAFLVGAFFAGMAGGMYAHFKQYIVPAGFGFDRSVEIVVMVILGGMGRTTGVVIAAILLTVMGEWLRQFGDLRMILYSVLIIVLMILRPQGIFTLTPKRLRMF
jgi:branched-chain amino acid transport system permease protein